MPYDIQKQITPPNGGVSWFSKERVIFGFIIIVLFFIIIYGFINQNNFKSQIEENKNKIEYVQKQNDSLSKANLDIRNKFSTFENNINAIDKKINNTNIQIDKIKKQTNEKVYIIDSYSVNELELFFTKRYGQVLNNYVHKEDNYNPLKGGSEPFHNF